MKIPKNCNGDHQSVYPQRDCFAGKGKTIFEKKMDAAKPSIKDRLARCMLPMLQKYYESEEGRKDIAKWQEKRDQKQDK